MDVFGQHAQIPPGTPVVFGMRQHVPDVHLLSIRVNSRNQSELIGSNIEDGKPADLIRRGKRDA